MNSDFISAYVAAFLLVVFIAFVTLTEVKFDACVKERHSLTACILMK